MNLEQKINYQLNKHPGLKKVVKSVYQHAMYAISPKIKSEGNITRISPNDPSHEYFFGYYDKSPWDITDRYVLCMRAKDTWSDVSPKEKADILLIDTTLPETDVNRVRKIAETSAWNVQQSCMLQWLGPDFSNHILFNDYRNGKYVAVIKELVSGAERVIDTPVYTVSADGKTALTLDFSRLYNLRPGYGYYNVPEKTEGLALPDATAVWKISLETGDVTPLLSYKDFATFQPRPEMQEKEAIHKVNHLMISPNGQRFMVLYRWFIGERKYTRLVTCNTDGTEMYVLSDDDMVSHCFWKDDEHILAFENKKEGGIGYYLMKDRTQEFRRCWTELTGDGHPSYNPVGCSIVTDSYPDRARIQYIRVMKDENSKPIVVAKVFSPFKYDNDTRCDLHPRWNHTGDKVCFDAVFEGHRGLYYVDIIRDYNEPIKVLFITDTLKTRFGVTVFIKNYLEYVDRNKVEIDVIAYENSETEVVDFFKKMGVKVYFMPELGIKTINSFRRYFDRFFRTNKYDIIHSHFNQIDNIVFPIAKKHGVKKLISHSHSVKLSDYKLRAVRNRIMCLGISNKADICAACSTEAGVALFGKKYKIMSKSVIIRNAIQCDKYIYDNEYRNKLRLEWECQDDTIIIGCVGSLKPLKNQSFLLDVFAKIRKQSSRYRLVIVGDGDERQKLVTKAEMLGIGDAVVFTGARNDVPKLLSAFDIYILPSLYEGLGISAIEAQANGLKCIVSDGVPNEADVTNNIRHLKLNDDIDLWVNSILNTDVRRDVDAIYKIKMSGYEIATEANKLEKLYHSLLNGTFPSINGDGN